MTPLSLNDRKNKSNLRVLYHKNPGGCYGVPYCSYTSNVHTEYQGHAPINYFDVLFRRTVCFSVLRTMHFFLRVEGRTAEASLRFEDCLAALYL